MSVMEKMIPASQLVRTFSGLPVKRMPEDVYYKGFGRMSARIPALSAAAAVAGLAAIGLWF
jgi:hypothetical protein